MSSGSGSQDREEGARSDGKHGIEAILTTLMITHNMKDAIQLGNRLIMMHEGNVIYYVTGCKKRKI